MAESLVYTIRMKGYLDEKWSVWFDGLQFIHRANGETLLVGELLDQTMLQGLLTKVFELGLPLIDIFPDLEQRNH